VAGEIPMMTLGRAGAIPMSKRKRHMDSKEIKVIWDRFIEANAELVFHPDTLAGQSFNTIGCEPCLHAGAHASPRRF
jgi:hypothetical protein